MSLSVRISTRRLPAGTTPGTDSVRSIRTHTATVSLKATTRGSATGNATAWAVSAGADRKTGLSLNWEAAIRLGSRLLFFPDAVSEADRQREVGSPTVRGANHSTSPP